jgi:hypothetical protein
MVRKLVPIVLLLLAAAGCGDDAGLDPEAAPADFAFEYDWYEGSVAPPWHYSFEIVLGADGSGSVTFWPDYRGSGVPQWTETLTPAPEEIELVYFTMYDEGVFQRAWEEDPEPPVGGSVAGITVVAAGETYEIPFDLRSAADREAAVVVYGAVEELVPNEVWREFEDRRTDYMDSYDG